jgi:hypothetical protein
MSKQKVCQHAPRSVLAIPAGPSEALAPSIPAELFAPRVPRQHVPSIPQELIERLWPIAAPMFAVESAPRRASARRR